MPLRTCTLVRCGYSMGKGADTTAVSYQARTQNIQEKDAGSSALAHGGRGELPGSFCLDVHTHQLVAELEGGVGVHLAAPGVAATEDADRTEPARHRRRSVAHADRRPRARLPSLALTPPLLALPSRRGAGARMS